MKVLAMYLPQFHRVKENDEWWGKGFTEWVAVKSANALFSGHKQPRVPLNNNYYNLLKKDVMQWQADLMHNYGVDGMVFYHYYFKKGRKILEKPAENLLKWKDIDMPFCFSWANETWARSWSNISGKNVWASDGTSAKYSENDDGILLRQEYGDKKDWLEHFYYLKPFFDDPRYIKVDGKPLFLIYKTESIGCLVSMLSCWRNEAQKCGFPGLYIISTNRSSDVCDGELFQEPQYTRDTCFWQLYKDTTSDCARKLEYKDVVAKSVGIQTELTAKNLYSAVFPCYDDTPRRGRAGSAIINSTPELFRNYLESIMKSAVARKSDLVFINAWNEWGETMYLEPDEEFGHKYLEAVKDAKAVLNSWVPENEMLKSAGQNAELIDAYERRLNKFQSFWNVLDRLLCLKEENKSFIPVFRNKKWNKVAVYGLGMIGRHFITEIESTGMHVSFGIDGKGKMITMNFPVYTLNEDIPDADVIIVTVDYEYGKIRQELEMKVCCDIISTMELLDMAFEEEKK